MIFKPEAYLDAPHDTLLMTRKYFGYFVIVLLGEYIY